ncbi:MAG: accessory factor UbiK family protein [Alphaproteobacteria bacterium]
MQPQNRILDDLARLAGGAAGALTGIKAEVEALVRQQFGRIIADMDLVSREEFEVVRAMAAEARAQQEATGRRPAAAEASAHPGSVSPVRPPRSARANLRAAARRHRKKP